jgi:hypothetical protein
MLKHFVAPIFWAGIILFLSSIPSNDIPSFTLWDLVKSDKIGHVIMYGVLVLSVDERLYPAICQLETSL